VKRRDATAPDRHGSIDGAGCSIFMGEALIFALAQVRSLFAATRRAAASANRAFDFMARRRG